MSEFREKTPQELCLEISRLLSLLAAERDAFGKRETELKAELALQEGAHGFDRERNRWKAKAEKIVRSWLDCNEVELNKLIVADIASQLDAAVKEVEERMYLHGESKAYKAYNEGFAVAREKAAEIARETNLNVHPDCGYAISRCIRAMTP